MFSLLFCVTCKVFIAYHNPLAVEYKSYVDTVNMCVMHVCIYIYIYIYKHTHTL